MLCSRRLEEGIGMYAAKNRSEDLG